MQQHAVSVGQHLPAPLPCFLLQACLILTLATTSLSGATAQGILDCQPCSASSECASGVCGDPALNTNTQLTCGPSDPSNPCLIAVPSEIRGSAEDCDDCSADEDCKSGLCSFQGGTEGFCISSDSTCVGGKAIPVGPAPTPTATVPTPSPAAAPAVVVPAPEPSEVPEDSPAGPHAPVVVSPRPSPSPSSTSPASAPQAPSTPTSQLSAQQQEGQTGADAPAPTVIFPTPSIIPSTAPTTTPALDTPGSQQEGSSSADGPASAATAADTPSISSTSTVATPTPSGARTNQKQSGTVVFLAAAAGSAALLVAR